jgi:hypothetical protein
VQEEENLWLFILVSEIFEFLDCCAETTTTGAGARIGVIFKAVIMKEEVDERGEKGRGAPAKRGLQPPTQLLRYSYLG